MDLLTLLIFLAPYLVVAIFGAALALVYDRNSAHSTMNQTKTEAAQILDNAKHQAETIQKEAYISAKEDAIKIKQEADEEIKSKKKAADVEERQRTSELRERENRLMQREESLDRRNDTIEKREQQLSQEADEVERRLVEADEILQCHMKELERISGLSKADAHKEILDKLRSDVTREAATIIRDHEQRVRMDCDRLSREILSVAIQRYSSEHVGEVTLATVHIPSDDLKGRIIGREGRNIRTFEQITGVNLIIDDTPEVIQLSSFDPVRREIARQALENLIADGRIHPARIEELYDKAASSVNTKIMEDAEQVCYDLKIHDLHPELMKTLGSLRYRTSFGQNVLDHSVEVAHLCEIMASELGLDSTVYKRAGLLHDLGKAIDHQIEGPHAVIGAELARKYGESAAVVHVIEAHHNDIEPTSVLDILVQAADACSAARPGARRESAETYIKRLEKLEEISNSHEGVERTYAMQAGREIRVMVKPEQISDADACVLAHDIAGEIETQMEYPGQVKVVVIRESRAFDIAK